MATSGLAISELEASVDERALLDRHLRVRVEGCTVRISGEALVRLQPPDVPVRLERITGGRIYLSTHFTVIGGTAEVFLSASDRGRARLEITSFKAAGFLPIATSAVVWAIRSFFPARPGVYFGEGNHLEVDIGEALAPFLPPELDLTIGPLRRAGAGEGILEFQF
jgi:hypothetical protein